MGNSIKLINKDDESRDASLNTRSKSSSSTIKDLIAESVEWLDLSNVSVNKEDYDYFKQLRTNQQIKYIDLSNNNLSTKLIKEISIFLIKNTTVKTLLVNNTNLTNMSLFILTETLIHNVSIETLYLSSNNIDNEGMQLISNLLKCNHNIKNINLSNNRFDLLGIKYFTDALESNKNINYCDLSMNHMNYYTAQYIIKSCLNYDIVIQCTKKGLICEIKELILNNNLNNISLYDKYNVVICMPSRSSNNLLKRKFIM